jgi:hypothetical protein
MRATRRKQRIEAEAELASQLDQAKATGQEIPPQLQDWRPSDDAVARVRTQAAKLEAAEAKRRRKAARRLELAARDLLRVLGSRPGEPEGAGPRARMRAGWPRPA